MSLRHRPVVPSQYATLGFRQDHLGNDGNIGHDHTEQKGVKKGLSRLSPTKHTVKSHRRKADGKKVSAVVEYERGTRQPDTSILDGTGRRDVTDTPKNFGVAVKFIDDYIQKFNVVAKDYKGALAQAVSYADSGIGTNQVAQVELTIEE